MLIAYAEGAAHVLRASRQAVQERPQPGGADPRAFELPGTEAIMRKEGERIVIELAPAASLLDLLARLAPIEDDFGDIADPLPDAVGQRSPYQRS
jgi:antitoxin VapB